MQLELLQRLPELCRVIFLGGVATLHLLCDEALQTRGGGMSWSNTSSPLTSRTLTFPLTKLATSSLFSKTVSDWSRLWSSQSQCLFTSSAAAPEPHEHSHEALANQPMRGDFQLTAGDYPARLRAGNLQKDAEGRDPGVGVQHRVQRPHQETCGEDRTKHHPGTTGKKMDWVEWDRVDKRTG